MTKIKLAEALLRRKELQAKVEILNKFKNNDLYYEIRHQRIKVTDGMDDLNLDVPKLTASQVTAEYDHYARALRMIDSAIQQANWISEIEANDIVMADYKQ
jgi:hypothetical protein